MGLTKNKKIRKRVSFWILLVLSAIWILPLLWMFGTSFKSPSDIADHVLSIIPYHPTLDNYIRLFQDMDTYPIFRWLGNSLMVSTIFTALYSVIVFFAGYVFGVLKWKGRNVVFGLILITMVIPGIINLIPLFQMINQFGWIPQYSDTGQNYFLVFLNFILPGLGGTFGLFIVRQFFLSIPYELIEQARIDGASDFKILFKIIFPLGRSAILVAALFAFIGSWNDYMWPTIIGTIFGETDFYLLQTGLATMQGSNNYDYGFVIAATVLSIIPILIVFLFVQSKIIDGVARTGIK
ncbi:MAG TPA: carbohydrate ABC transporter permease [Bacilli bacterium]|nr:carbohydrate ABC transporter permease [Bacilli bacterium]